MRHSVPEAKGGKRFKLALISLAVLASAGTVFYFGTGIHEAKDSRTSSPSSSRSLPKSLSLPLFFEPNQGQTVAPVRFLAHGAGYGLFLTADGALLHLQRTAADGKPSAASIIRMRIDGANPAGRISGTQPLPGKSNYFIGNDPAKWRRDIPQFGGVEYKNVYSGVDLVYYGNQGQLEYDFRLAPAADPNQIALSFDGASTHIDVANSGDLILSTPNGDVRFHAPRVYQPGLPQSGVAEKTIPGRFRLVADNKIGFTIGDYDHSRELIIDPTLAYSTYFGGNGSEGPITFGSPYNKVEVAVDSDLNIYLAGSTTSATGIIPNPLPTGTIPPVQDALTGAQNVFIAKISPLNVGTNTPQLVFATYLGSSGSDNLTGLAVDSSDNIYVAGTTASTDSSFPTTSNAFQTKTAVTTPGTHGFISKLSLNVNLDYTLTYSTYLAGNGTDHVTGLAIDTTQNAYVTGDTTSNSPAGNGFPANSNGFQTSSNTTLGNPQFFASKINTNGIGSGSMLYSTYFGGGNFPSGADLTLNQGGGIAVDPSASTVNMYITGTTNMLATGLNGGPGFPLFSPQQPCLNEPPHPPTPCPSTSNTDAFIAKINPNLPSGDPVYSTYLGGSGDDYGLAIAVDTSGNAYVVGSTNSSNWDCSNCVGGLQTNYAGTAGETNGFMVKVGNLINGAYALDYFTYLGGPGPDVAQGIQVDGLSTAHIAGYTSGSLTLTNPIQPIPPAFSIPSSPYSGATYGRNGDAFVAQVSTTTTGADSGNYLTYLGGSGIDQGTGIALDAYNATYVAGTTQSANFPTYNGYEAALSSGPQAAFVSELGSFSQLNMVEAAPSPNPVAAGTQVAFTFNITDMGPDPATNVIFTATVPSSGLASPPTAKTSTGSCNTVTGTIIVCNIPTLAVCAGCTAGASGSTGASVEVDVTPAITTNSATVSVGATVIANNGLAAATITQPQSVNIVNFTVRASVLTPIISAGDTATIQAIFCPSTSSGYNATITPGDTIAPSMVTATTPTFLPISVTLSGNACETTTLSIATVARPVNTGRLFRRRSIFYAVWLPVAGLGLIGLGTGIHRKRRRRWLVGALLCLIAAAILLLPGCGSAATTTTSSGGTLAGQYTVTITGSAGSGSSQTYQVVLQVN